MIVAHSEIADRLSKALRTKLGFLLHAGGTGNTKSRHGANPQRIKKRHWVAGTSVILLGSWITHTTTARIYDDFTSKQALEFARALPDSGQAMNASLPNEIYHASFQRSHGPMSADLLVAQSPADYLFEPPAPALEVRSYKVKRGDTLGSIFKKLDLDLSLPYKIQHHDVASDLVKLSIGREIAFGENSEGELKEITYPLSSLQNLHVDIDAGDITAAEVADVPYEVIEKSVSGEISSSLYEAALDAGLSIAQVMEMVRIFGWDIDFVLDIRAGDSFHVIVEELQSGGEKLTDGNIVAAEFTTQGTSYRAIRFDDGGDISYFNPEGESMLGTFLRSPVEFSRISSRFGKRKHPIHKVWRAHKGVDYAASRGTPIRATADGKVIHAGRKGGYGNAVILRHAGRFSTLYAHMTGFAKGVRSGNRVKQGDVIGYVGSTGQATGPHLHYEFRLDGVHRNPLTFKTPKASAVSADNMAAFMAQSQQQLARIDQLRSNYQLAKGDTSSDTSTL